MAGRDEQKGELLPFPTQETHPFAPGREGAGAEPSDEELLVAAGRGSSGAFASLVHRHHATAYRTAHRFLGDAEEARDIAQEAFLHLLRSSPKYAPQAPFRAFLYRIISNLCADHRRKLRPAAVAELPELPSDAPGPLGDLAAKEREAAVRKALAALPERQRLAVILKYFEGLGYREMADALETSEKAVERLLNRARETLLRDLSPHIRH